MKLSRHELIALVERIILADGDEESLQSDILLLQNHVLHPEVLDLIYYLNPPLSATEVVDIALSYQPIIQGLMGYE